MRIAKYLCPEVRGYMRRAPSGRRSRRRIGTEAVWTAFHRGARRLGPKSFQHFAAGAQVVWDVDVLKERVVRVYRADNPDNPTTYRSGDVADAEPALTGWSMPVDDLLP